MSLVAKHPVGVAQARGVPRELMRRRAAGCTSGQGGGSSTSGSSTETSPVGLAAAALSASSPPVTGTPGTMTAANGGDCRVLLRVWGDGEDRRVRPMAVGPELVRPGGQGVERRHHILC